jgi:hypothetical protein
VVIACLIGYDAVRATLEPATGHGHDVGMPPAAQGIMDRAVAEIA